MTQDTRGSNDIRDERYEWHKIPETQPQDTRVQATQDLRDLHEIQERHNIQEIHKILVIYTTPSYKRYKWHQDTKGKRNKWYKKDKIYKRDTRN